MTRSEAKALLPILSDPANDDRTPEEVAELLIATLDQFRAARHGLAVVARFELQDQQFEAVVGPMSTRAPAAAREVGRRFAFDYKSRSGSGMFKLLPLIRNPQDAWDHARKLTDEWGKSGERREDPHLPLPEDVQRAISESMAWTPDPDLLASLKPACTCGLRIYDGPCTRHPEGTPP